MSTLNVTNIKAADGTSSVSIANSTGAATLSSSITVSGDLTVDTNVLKVDTTNDRIGIVESSPNGRLHINSTGQDNASGNNIVLDCSAGGGQEWVMRVSEPGVNNGWFILRNGTQSAITVQQNSRTFFSTSTDGNGLSGGNTVNIVDAQNLLACRMTSSSNSQESNIQFAKNGSEVGYVNCTLSSTVYGTSSDERMKENIQDADSASSIIDSIKIRKFDWKESHGGNHQTYGTIAQELYKVYPDAVATQEDSDKMWGVDYSTLVPALIKEIQELRTRVAVLESK
tara:strand:+ start:134 stop:985 length:852 start_codon:yes stop_codon:yes gene_type:complete